MSKFDWSGLVKAVLPSVLGLGTCLIMNNQNVQNAQGQANAQQQQLDTQYAIALANQQAIAVQNQGGGKTVEPPPKSNTALYIGLGVGGLVLISVIIFAVTRNKE